MLKVLGEEKYSYFFDKFLEYFFTESDAKAFASLGLNAIRLPINYRHLEDDMNPRVFKKEGLKHLDRVIELVSGQNLPFTFPLISFPGDVRADIPVDHDIAMQPSAPNTGSTRSSTSTPLLVRRTLIGTAIWVSLSSFVIRSRLSYSRSFLFVGLREE
jgi:hypothetical protein